MCVCGGNKARLTTILSYFKMVLRLRLGLCSSGDAQHQQHPRSDTRLLSCPCVGGVSEKEKAAAAG